MNLLLEQRPIIVSSKLQQQSTISNENDMNSSSSSSSSSSTSLVLKLKRHTNSKQQENNLNSMINEDNQQSRSTNSSRLKRSIVNNNSTATAARRPSSPAFNGKQQATKRSVTIDNNNNDLTASNDDNSSTKRFKTDELNSSSSSSSTAITTAGKVDASVETVSVGLATEPDQLGPCEPGTSVVLEGIVWNETDGGVLVVNVTWRGKTYVGTLLDSTKQDWACPRLICESPTSDYDARHTSKTSRSKRGTNSRYSNSSSSISNFAALNSAAAAAVAAANLSNDDRKLRNNIKTRQSKRTNPALTEELSTNQSSPLPSPGPNNSSACPQQSKLIPCTETDCHKQFTSSMALNFHVSDAHRKNQQKTIATQPPILPPAPPVPSTRDEEDVAHILVNVAEYVRRSSPPPAITKRASSDQQHSPALSWPCPQISSNLVLSSHLNNSEQTPTSITRSIVKNDEINTSEDSTKNQTETDDAKTLLSTVKPADQYLAKVQDEAKLSLPNTSPPQVSSHSNGNPWTDPKKERTSSKKSNNGSTPSPPLVSTDVTTTSLTIPASSSFVPISTDLTQTAPPKSSSPAYSDISDEDLTSRNEHEQNPPSTINLLTGNHEKIDEHEQTFLPNSRWTTQMLLQQYGSFMQQQSFINSNAKETPTNRLNSKTSSNGSAESMVKNILDARRLSITKTSSPSSIANDSNDFSKSLYHYHNNGITATEAMINTLTSPNENLLKPNMNNPLDYSINPNHCSSTLNSSR